ncbi:energy-coupling factor ABC transporter ATP-binding protein [Streptococcus fryi]
MTNIIEVNHLSFAYSDDDDKKTLSDVSFHVKQGEWLSIIGHNGSGKSTTVRLIDGLLEPSSGTITICGQELTVDNVLALRQKIGMVFQNPDNQFVGATVEDDVAFGLENKGVPLDEMTIRVTESLKRVGMQEFSKREPARLSGGQKQRVAIAGAIALRPDIIILDEATSMLDPEGRLELIRIIKDVREEFGLTVISITHDLDEVALSDRVLVMKQGKVVSDVTPRELFAKGDELLQLGLDCPFTMHVLKALEDKGISLPTTYLTEKELEDYIWQSVLKRSDLPIS